jgi:hypothetical protein
VRNNFRGRAFTKAAGPRRKPSRNDIIWRDNREAVKAKIYTMHNEDNPEPSEPDDQASFVLRTAAAKAVYEGMTIEEQRAVEKQAQVTTEQPTPSDIQEK